MNENDLYLKWDNGSMAIHMDEFFPCSEKRLKDLYTKVINVDPSWDRRNKVTDKLKSYFQKMVLECEAESKAYGKLYLDHMQKKADAEHRIKDKTHPNGVRLTKEELKAFREQKKNNLADAKMYLQLSQKKQRDKKQFEKHLVYLETVQRW